MKNSALGISLLFITPYLISCTYARNDDFQEFCSKGYEDKLILTNTKVVKPYLADFPDSPYPNKVTKGCVGIKFDLAPNGTLDNIEIIQASPPKFFNRAAIQALKKYTFEKSDKPFQEAYMVIEFNLD